MSIPSWAVRGAKVVCINDHGYRTEWPGAYPVKGGVYTIDGADLRHPDAIFLEECGPVDGLTCSWSATRFRPLVTEKDDLATHFEQYLKTDHRATERERA